MMTLSFCSWLASRLLCSVFPSDTRFVVFDTQCAIRRYKHREEKKTIKRAFVSLQDPFVTVW